jgi:hypothetical protein
MAILSLRSVPLELITGTLLRDLLENHGDFDRHGLPLSVSTHAANHLGRIQRIDDERVAVLHHQQQLIFGLGMPRWRFAGRISDRGDQDRWLIATHFGAAGDHRQHRGCGRHDPHLCCSWAIYFSAVFSSENNFSLEPPGRL